MVDPVSYIAVPAPVLAGPPGINDGALKGYVVGSVVIDGSASPPDAYTCTDDTPGAAAWEKST